MKKMTSLLIALIFAVGALACNSTPDVDNTVPDETNLWIYVIEKGYGVQWLEALADEFERRNEGVTVHVTATVNENIMIQSFDAGPTKNDYDIYFDTGPSVHSQLSVKSNKFEGYEQGLYDLTELYGTTIPGEEDTFGGKMNESIREIISVEEDGEEHFYSVPWTLGTTGINYSVELVESVLGADRQLPRTTEELYDFAKDFQNSAAEGQYAFAYPGGLDQWYAMLYTWWAQYEGLENYQNFFNAEYYDPVRGKMAVGPQIFNQQGRLKALEALEKLIRIEEGLHEKGINAYDVNTFRQLQTTFVVGEKYAMYPCGDWLAQESDDEDAKEIRFMKTPVISSIIDQNRTNNRLKVITTESLLRLAVSVVDGELDRAELETAVAEEHPSYAATDLTADLKIIDEARRRRFL